MAAEVAAAAARAVGLQALDRDWAAEKAEGGAYALVAGATEAGEGGPVAERAVG